MKCRLALTVLVLAIACTRQETRLSKFAEAVSAQPSADQPSLVSLADHTDFEWDRVYVFAPYTSYDDVLATIGTQWERVEDTGIAMRDDANLIVFTHGGDVVKFAMYPRSHGDLTDSAPLRGLSRQEARFIPQRVDRGGPWVVLRPVAQAE